MRPLSNSINSRGLVFWVVMACLAVVGTAVGGTIYVDASASGSANGSSWTNAYNYLQDALADANYLGVPVEIWVAAGTYTPDVNSAVPGGSGNQNATFQLINGVAIYGGFPVGGGIWEDRDPNLYETVLNGDLYDDDDLVIEPGPGGGFPGENCAEAGPINRGDTVFDNTSSTTDGPGDCNIYNDIWYVYTAEYTGYYKVGVVAVSSPYFPALSVYEGATCPPTVLMRCGGGLFAFTEDTDYLMRIGGQYTDPSGRGTGTITITRELLADNSYHVVTGSGTDANAVLDGFTITGGNANGADPNDDGGGMFNDTGSPTVANCTFSGNKGRDGGGMMNYLQSSPTVTNCTFSGNSADSSGGGMMNYSGSSPTVTNCIFAGNSAGTYGGGMMNYLQSSPTVTNCTFSGNSTDRYGGGMYNEGSSPTIVNCTFNDNSAERGGAIYSYRGSNPTLTNCILYGDTGMWGREIYVAFYSESQPATTTVSYSNVQEGPTGVYLETGSILNWEVGNIDADPCFVDPNNGDYHLKSEGWSWDTQRKVWTWDDVTSPCIDAGNPGYPLGQELLSVPDDPNNEWGENLRINMGAYGGTAEASMPPYDWAILADLTNDGKVNLNDLAAFVDYWLDGGECIPSDLNRNQFVDFVDFALLGQDWFLETSWYAP